jgi:tetratricopeptide (TPR) repeat protein
MDIDWDRIQELQEDADGDRGRGDRLRKEGKTAEARIAYEAGEKNLREALSLLGKEETPQAGKARAEILGSIAGFLRRTDRDEEAFVLYDKGAAVENRYNLPSTYNRVNRLKYMLLTKGQDLAGLEPEIRNTAEALNRAVNNPRDQRAGDSAWSWADLGDCLALLGDLDGAARAYTTFIKKASSKSPETTLNVLKNIASALHSHNDPGAERLDAAIERLESALATRTGGTT